ncbi:MAG: hypothetical protein KJO85_10925, partial [Gammaproteobacteria bacterium]|nr:hypothetical protein [Gammaproteobacteria bacterium]
MIDFQGHLWLGIGNFNVPYEGASLMRTANGFDNWETLVGDGGTYFIYGFNDWRNWGIRSFSEFQDELYIGTAQCWDERCDPFVTGLQIWAWSGEICP